MALDLPSYLLGKSKGGGGEPPVLIEKSISQNGTYNASTDEADGYSKVVVNVQAGGIEEYFKNTISAGDYMHSGVADMVKKLPASITVEGTSLAYSFNYYKGSELPTLDTTNVTNFSYAFGNCINITTSPLYNTSSATTLNDMFNGCTNLTTIPQFDTSNATNLSGMLRNCNKITNIPLLNTSKVTTMTNMLTNINFLTDTSLDNILVMCANVSQDYNQAKTLRSVCGMTVIAGTARIQSMPHYQDFIDAGWTIS